MFSNTAARQALLGGIAALLPMTPAWADEDDAASGAPIVVTGERAGYAIDDGSTATKTPTALIDVPQSITVVTRQQLDDQATQQLGDALRYVPGVTVGTGEGNRDQIILRGQSTTADFYLDGLRDDAQYFRPLYNVERIEVLKGANAMIFGRGGGGGVINRVSKTADPAKSFATANASIDSFGAFDIAADANLPLGETLAGRLDATYQQFANHRDFYDGRFVGVSPTLTANLGADTRLAASYTYDDDRRAVDRGVPSFAGRPLDGYDETFFGVRGLNRESVKAHVARARIDHTFSDALSANASVQYAHYDKYYGNVQPRAAATLTTVELEGYNSTTVRENWIGQANIVWQGDTGGLHHTLLAGVEASRQDTDATRAEALFTGGTNGGLRIVVPLSERIAVPVVRFGPLSRSSTSRVETLSTYIQDQLEIGERLQIVAGVRYDDFRIESTNRLNAFAARRGDGKWSPRIGLIAKPQANLSLYASYAKSFLPQSGDQFTVLDATTATLAPEAFENIEAGVKWDLARDLAFTAAAFRLDRDNSRATDPISGNVVLTGSTRTKGIEAQLAGRLTPRWQASLGFVFQDGEIRSTTTAAPAGRKLAQLPKFQASAWTRYDVAPGLGFGLGVIHQARQFASISNAVLVPAFTRVDAAAFWDVTDRVALQLNVENLFDIDYYPSAHTDNNIFPGEPISARVGVRVKL